MLIQTVLRIVQQPVILVLRCVKAVNYLER